MEKVEKIITIVEGRDENTPTVTEFSDSARALGWRVQRLRHIGSDDISENNFDNFFSKYVVWRGVSRNDTVDVTRTKIWLNNHNRICINTSGIGGIECDSNKFFEHGVFSDNEKLKNHLLPMYKVHLGVDQVLRLVREEKLEYPFLLKDREGTTGDNIFLIKNEDDLRNYDGPSWGDMIAEKYIEVDYEWRVFVIGGAVAGIMRKQGDPDNPENFKISCAGYVKEKEDRQEVREIIGRIACEAALSEHLTYVGADILHDKKSDNYYICEINIAAGWQNQVYSVTGEDIGGEMVRWFDDMHKVEEMSLDLAIGNYIQNRLGRLSRGVQSKYIGILKWEVEPADDEKTFDLLGRLARYYSDIKNNRDVTDKEIYELVKEVEATPISWAGCFLGEHCGVLEDGCIPSAYYIAIKRKYKRLF